MRAIILENVYELSKTPYQRFAKKNNPWLVSVTDLLDYKPNTLGHHLGCFLLKHNFQLQAKLENHDVFHVLTNTGITVSDEISMQFYLWGNGKHSLYQYSVICMGTILYPDYFKFFLKAFRRGKKALKFYQLDFSKLLHQPINKIKSAFLIH